MKFRYIALILVSFVLFLYGCSSADLAWQNVSNNTVSLTTEEQEVVFSEFIFGDVLDLDGSYNCTVKDSTDKTILYITDGDYRIEFTDLGSYATGVRRGDGGLCVTSWSNRNSLSLKNCITKQQYDNLKATNRLHEVNPGDFDIPSYDSNLVCTTYSKNVNFYPPTSYNVLDFSNPGASSNGTVLVTRNI